VQIFFAVSGFLITSTTLRRWGMLKAVNVAAFYQMRFALHRAIAGGAADDTERAPFCAGDPLHCPGEDGRARTRSGRVLTFHVDILEAGGGFLPGSWDILWSLPVEEMFLSLFSADLPGPARRKLLICAAGRICRDGSRKQGPGWRMEMRSGGNVLIWEGWMQLLWDV
jgi:hypothetical protein